ncbi:endothelin-converting enzyme 1-like [Stylophora pistillata]|uniref:endothelin-converting enzyme 1-like n=1 Tax=Stylophora pistillata TaxID=50429 RepID=UPI000C046988|nr:endothelin-converting enzyme 1-like [Stylophora pistillata]
MTELIKEEFISGLDSLEWMSSLTKTNARIKRYYTTIKDLTVGEYLFENTKNALTFVADETYGSLDKPVDRDQWFMGPSQVNGYYSPRQNRIVFLAAILQPPFYNPNYPKYLNYGGIGMVIGHEVTHGFDDNGNEFNFFTIFHIQIDGNQTLNENIADNGGLKLAFKAYKSLVAKEGTEGTLPGLGLTEEQLFFIGFAQPWCSIYKKKAALLQLQTDSHTFPKYRIFGPLHNYDKFAEAYKCKAGSPMNPAKKCTLW